MKNLSNKEINRLVDILLNADLTKPINFSSAVCEIEFDSIANKEFREELYANTRSLLLKNSEKSIFKVLKKKGQLSFSAGEWGRETSDVESSKGHFFYNSSSIHSNYFFQIELAFCLVDDKFIYLTKKMYKGGGKGAMKKYYNGYFKKFNVKDIKKPFDDLVTVLDTKTIDFEDNTWMSICEIELDKLYQKEYEEEILYNILGSIRVSSC